MKIIKKNSGRPLLLLLIAAIVFLLLSRIPFGNYIQWPFVIITTFIHEMGHGLTAIIVGGELLKVEIYQNASGVAWTRTIGGWRQAAVAAGGLLAPSIAGAIFIMVGRNAKKSAITFLSLSLFILLCCALWIRSSFGLSILIPVGVLFLVLSQKSSQGFQQFLIQFMGVHMLVDTFTRTLNYVFSSSASVGGEIRHSDTSTIAQHLIGGHFFWACTIALISIAILVIALRNSYLK